MTSFLTLVGRWRDSLVGRWRDSLAGLQDQALPAVRHPLPGPGAGVCQVIRSPSGD
ncbi:MAG: hypothetical protein GWO24_18540 [Akkermansiaceae bacterium]|nr:hypothetical protein [Akkermansiaceae bacterium]